MYPVICRIGPFTIFSYGLMLVIAFAVASTLAVREAKRQKVNPEIIYNLLFFSLLSGIIGARLFYVVENFAYYFKEPAQILMLQQGGLSWFGGLILGAGFAVIYLKLKRQSVYKALDLIIPFLALAQAIGRIGCLLNGCCFGRTVIPVQIYSSFILIMIFVILRLLQDRPHPQGTVFFAYLLLYSLKRFFIEFWRSDNQIIFSRLTLFQLLSIVVFLISLLCLILIQRRKA